MDSVLDEQPGVPLEDAREDLVTGTGGVTASYAMLGDLNIAEPKALIGFAGPRVIEQTIRQKLPEGFQRSEYLLEHGMVDAVIHRHKLRETLSARLGAGRCSDSYSITLPSRRRTACPRSLTPARFSARSGMGIGVHGAAMAHAPRMPRTTM